MSDKTLEEASAFEMPPSRLASKTKKANQVGIVLIPQPSDNPNDPLVHMSFFKLVVGCADANRIGL